MLLFSQMFHTFLSKFLYGNEGFSFYLNLYKWRKKVKKVLNNRIIFEPCQAFTMTNNVASCFFKWCHIFWHQVSLIAYTVVSSVISINISKYKNFHGPDEVTLFVKVKVCVHLIFCYLEPYRTLFIFYMDLNRMRNLHVYIFLKLHTHVYIYKILMSMKC